jgi:murein DD-endopeptidase MepM/ murein hydrolase activator NlpD
MADENDQNELDLTDDEAEQLLADAVTAEEQTSPESVTDERDWKAEADRWKSLSRKNENAAKQNAAKLKQYEDANKTESQRLQEERDSHRTRAERAEAALRRRDIAEARAPEHATAAQIKAVAKRLAGESDDDLEADADELFAFLAPAPTSPKTPSRPKERLRGGSEPDEPVETDDPRKLAASIPRGQLR